jgi:peptide/nickel transport system permease protein
MTALLALVAGSALTLGFAIGGQIVIERVFWAVNWKDYGKAAWARDHRVTQAAFFLRAAMVIGLKFPNDLSANPLEVCIRLEPHDDG